MKDLAFASGSAHKAKEMSALLEPLGFRILLPKDLGIPNFSPEETEDSFLGNSFIKSKALFAKTGLPSFADDSGISVQALDGRPGVQSARFGGPNLSDRERAELLLQELSHNSVRTAFYTCVITYVSSVEEKAFEGKVFGEISYEYDAEGKFGFGYDPIFFYPPLGKRFSEIPEWEKNKVSHRKIAMDQLVSWLRSLSQK